MVTSCIEKTLTSRRAGKIVWERKLLNQDNQVVQHGQFETLVSVKQVAPTPHVTNVSAPAKAATIE